MIAELVLMRVPRQLLRLAARGGTAHGDLQVNGAHEASAVNNLRVCTRQFELVQSSFVWLPGMEISL